MSATNEEAIKELKTRYLTMSQCLDKEELHRANEALDMAIKALDQVSHLNNRPCEACEYHKEAGCVRWKCVFEE